MKRDYPTINKDEILTAFLPLLRACGVTMPVNAVAGDSQKREASYGRSIISQCLRKYGFTFAQIGFVLGGRDHVTVRATLNRSEYEGDRVINNHVLSAFKNPELRAAVNQAVIKFHEQEIEFHQGVINKINNAL